MSQRLNTLVFFHVPKCAGSSFRKFITDNVGRDRTLVVHNYLDLAYLSDIDLASYRAVVGHIGVGFKQRLAPNDTTLTVLRDPVDRVVSHYYYWRTSTNAVRDKFGEQARLAKQLSFSDFLDQCREGQSLHPQFANLQTWQMFFDFHNAARKKFHDVPPHEVLAIAKRNLDSLTHVGFAHRLNDSIAWLASQMGWDRPADFSRQRVTVSRPELDAIDAADLARIRSLVELDVELYEYARQRYLKPAE